MSSPAGTGPGHGGGVGGGGSGPSPGTSSGPTAGGVRGSCGRRITFDNVAGLDEHLKVLKEILVLPLMYREVYTRFSIKPPRGVLFYGPPGTGKTLVAGALANECSRGDRKVSFFSRKGADCYSKYVGESEQKLRNIFEVAKMQQPAIIFFDEIDGMAPTRSSRHDIVHASVVSTLLALMDGLDTSADVVVIGATNRIDAIDPALRRPGRFDRELYFPLPALRAREQILHVHLRHWRRPPSDAFIQQLAANTVGYCGSDLQALCTEAVLCGLRRAYPDIYNCTIKQRINFASLRIDERDFSAARKKIVAASKRAMVSPVKRLTPSVQPLLSATFARAVKELEQRYSFTRGSSTSIDPWFNITIENEVDSTYRGLEISVAKSAGFLLDLAGLQEDAQDIFTVSSQLDDASSLSCPSLLLAGHPGQGQTTHLGPAILHRLEHLPTTVLDIAALFEHSCRGTEEACISRIKQACQHIPGVLYVPDVTSWWWLVDEATRAVFLSLTARLDSTMPVLLLGTAHMTYEKLPKALKNVWPDSDGRVFMLTNPDEAERESFFRGLLMERCLKPPQALPLTEDASNDADEPSREDVENGKLQTRPDNGADSASENEDLNNTVDLSEEPGIDSDLSSDTASENNDGDLDNVAIFNGSLRFRSKSIEFHQRRRPAKFGTSRERRRQRKSPIQTRARTRAAIRDDGIRRSRARQRSPEGLGRIQPRSTSTSSWRRTSSRVRSRSALCSYPRITQLEDMVDLVDVKACDELSNGPPLPSSHDTNDDPDIGQADIKGGSSSKKGVIVDVPALLTLLQRAVQITKNQPICVLEALYASLASAMTPFEAHFDRRALPQALTVVLDDFETSAPGTAIKPVVDPSSGGINGIRSTDPSGSSESQDFEML